MGPFELRMENERLRARVNDLYRDLMCHVQKHGRLETPCEHVTMRPPHLPCPHPECYTPKCPTLIVERLGPNSFDYSVSEPPEMGAATREVWRVVRLVMGKEEFWAWRRA